MSTDAGRINRHTDTRHGRRFEIRLLPRLLAVCIVVLVYGGCAAPSGKLAKQTPRQINATQPSQRIPSAELDELTRGLADRYVGLLASACDALQKDNPDPVQRREAQDLLANGSTNVYDIASNADAFTRTLDLVVVTTLVSQVWIDDDRASMVFGKRGDVLVRALHHGRVEAWALAGRVLKPAQLALLDYLIWDWRRQNPDMVRVSFVRFSNFAVGRGQSANAEVLAASGLFANIGQAGQAVAEARLLSERMFYLFKRYPTLLRWQLQAAKDDMVATPEVGSTLSDLHRLTDQVEQLPKHVAAERKAILSGVDKRNLELRKTIAQVRGAVADTNTLVKSVARTSDSLNETLKTAGPLVARLDAWDRWRTALPGHRPFDIREYAKAARQLSTAAQKMNKLVQSSDKLLGSSQWDRRLQQVNQSVDARMNKAAEQSQRVINTFFWQVYLAMGILFIMLIICLVLVFVLIRQVRLVSARTVDPPSSESPK